jgi:hypothetical protein
MIAATAALILGAASLLALDRGVKLPSQEQTEA